MQVIDNKALLFVTKKHDQVLSLIPEAHVLDTNGDKAKMLVRWTFDAWRILRNLGIKNPPHPILGKYKWPGMYVPFDHQRTTAAFLATHSRCYVLNEAGTGKTSSAAWAADYLMQQGQVSRVLVVCPVSIMDTAWRADLFKTIMHRTVGIATGTRAQRTAVIESGCDIVIINFDGVKTVKDALKAGGFDLVIIDEATALKSTSTDRWKAVAELITPSTRIWAMTGTPAAQAPTDAFGLARLVTPNRVPSFFSAWKDKVMVKVSEFRWVPRMDAMQTVYAALQPAIRFTKEECLDLPDMLYVTREVEMTKQQQKYYDMIKQQMMAVAAGSEITAANAAVLLNKLAQVAQGSVYADDKSVIEFDVKNRVNELLSIVDSTPHKVLVFVPYRHTMDMLIEVLAKHLGGEEHVEMIRGGVGATQRADIIKRFQTTDVTKVLLLAPQATAHGITLTRADQVVWWGPVASTELYLQANARAHRAGQVNKVTVTHLQGSPVERRMYAALQDKVGRHTDLVEMFKQELDQ